MKIEEDADRIRAGMAPLHGAISEVYLGLVDLQQVRQAHTWKAFRTRYEAEYLDAQRPRTREKGCMVLEVFEQECHPKTVREINEQMLSTFAAKLRRRPVVKRAKVTGQVGLAPWTIKNYLGALHTAHVWAATQKLIREVPAFPAIRVPKLRPQPIAEPDWLKLLAQAPTPLWRAFLLCGWYGGLRLSEAYRLAVAAPKSGRGLDLGAERIVLPARFVKAGEDQWIPLHPELRAVLADLPDNGERGLPPFRSRRTGEALTRNGVTNNVIDMARRAGVKLSMHSLRKGLGCRVAAQLGKGNAPVLHRLMRHSSMQITMDFYASVDNVLHDAIRQLDQASPALPPASPPAGPESQERTYRLTRRKSFSIKRRGRDSNPR